MSDERSPLGDADHEEARAAAALQQALDGGSGGTDLPDAALETAALLRYGGGFGSLSTEGRARVREELLSSLPRAPAQRRRFRAWLALGVPAACGATLLAALWVRGLDGSGEAEREELTSAAPAEATQVPARREGSRSAAGDLAKNGARLAPGSTIPPGLAQAAQEYRKRLIPALKSPDLERAHALSDQVLLDSGASREDVERAQRSLINIAAAPASSDWSTTEARLMRQDLFCRLAEAALRLGQPEAAIDWTRQGLDLDGPPTPFLAQLSALEGQAKEALGDRPGAAHSYMRALEINDALLTESLDGAP